MYMKPTVIFCSKASPVRPSKSRTFPEQRRPGGRFSSTTKVIGESGFCFVHSISASSTSASVAPSKTGVAIGVGPPFALASSSSKTPCAAAQPRWVSRICPMFIRLGTPSGFSTTSTGRPSSRNGMSSSGTIFAITPLLPWRPASLSPSAILRFFAT
jgi:hypothetical protein